eukprot:CAMPEP_0119391298 /NCGR_PEP_ID=MMETSP1334-20130426/116585_1 /TAXON_ID=127549 /ORGANISM="Calcidiscus leptoporus, Strain RCC1130" /LENGTH=66 /DNA_ID=CAMNT_0007413951 /DNA_START=4 /DNA_END=203 /DNA_ORIENTATION=+
MSSSTRVGCMLQYESRVCTCLHDVKQMVAGARAPPVKGRVEDAQPVHSRGVDAVLGEELHHLLMGD